MWIVAIAWVYVVGLMALTETSIIAGIMTFCLYCVFPLSILYYLTGSGRRRARRERSEQSARSTAPAERDSRAASADAADAPGGSDSAD